MKTFRRVEIRVFQRKVTSVSGEFEVEKDEAIEASLQTDNALETVSPDSAAGKRVISTVVRLLEDYLSN